MIIINNFGFQGLVNRVSNIVSKPNTFTESASKAVGKVRSTQNKLQNLKNKESKLRSELQKVRQDISYTNKEKSVANNQLSQAKQKSGIVQ